MWLCLAAQGVQTAIGRLRSGRLYTPRHASPAALARLLGCLADAGAHRQRLERFAAHHLAGGGGGAAADPVLKVLNHAAVVFCRVGQSFQQDAGLFIMTNMSHSHPDICQSMPLPCNPSSTVLTSKTSWVREIKHWLLCIELRSRLNTT